MPDIKLNDLLSGSYKNVFKPDDIQQLQANGARWVDGNLISKDGQVLMQAPSVLDAAEGMNNFMPVTGDIQAGAYAINDLTNGNYGSAALNAAGLLPFVPAMGGMTKAAKKLTDFEKKHLTAQKNATEMLGLPPNNTAMERAKALGFDTPAYHGTAADFQTIDTSKLGSSTGANSAKSAFWAAKDPKVAEGYAHYAANDAPVRRVLQDAETYERLAQKTGSKRYWDLYDDALSKAELLETKLANQRLNGQNVIPMVVKSKSNNLLDAGDETFFALEGEVNNLLKSAKRGGKDLSIIKNLDDAAGFSNIPTDHYGILNPSAVRSKFAAFDPKRAHEADILGRADVGLLGGISLASILGLGTAQHMKDK